jgi:hypothetical protein
LRYDVAFNWSTNLFFHILQQYLMYYASPVSKPADVFSRSALWLLAID